MLKDLKNRLQRQVALRNDPKASHRDIELEYGFACTLGFCLIMFI